MLVLIVGWGVGDPISHFIHPRYNQKVLEKPELTSVSSESDPPVRPQADVTKAHSHGLLDFSLKGEAGKVLPWSPRAAVPDACQAVSLG